MPVSCILLGSNEVSLLCVLVSVTLPPVPVSYTFVLSLVAALSVPRLSPAELLQATATSAASIIKPIFFIYWFLLLKIDLPYEISILLPVLKKKSKGTCEAERANNLKVFSFTGHAFLLAAFL